MARTYAHPSVCRPKSAIYRVIPVKVRALYVRLTSLLRLSYPPHISSFFPLLPCNLHNSELSLSYSLSLLFIFFCRLHAFPFPFTSTRSSLLLRQPLLLTKVFFPSTVAGQATDYHGRLVINLVLLRWLCCVVGLAALLDSLCSWLFRRSTGSQPTACLPDWPYPAATVDAQVVDPLATTIARAIQSCNKDF